MKNENNKAHGYWCTWVTQNYTAERLLKSGKSVCDRDMMNEQNAFGSGGWVEQFDGARGDLYFLLDDGWDVPYGVNPWDSNYAFGSLEVSEERFPSVKGMEPKDRLKYLNDLVKSKGWRGLGLWVAAQCVGSRLAPGTAASREEATSQKTKDYWRERILWSKYAGIGYWKVDWGDFKASSEFREFLTAEAEALYPELVIEHASCCPSINGFIGQIESGKEWRFCGDKEVVDFADKVLSYCEVFRSYDVLAPLSVPSTLDRLGVLLPKAKGYVNAEDELYIAAALGLQMGVMRNEFGAGRSDKTAYSGNWGARGADCDRLGEIYAAVKWQRLAPPFKGGNCRLSDEVLFDDYHFEKGDGWCGEAYGKTVKQGAPCVISRNAPLPCVLAGKSGEKPYVVASAFENGAYGVCVLPRVINGQCKVVGGEITCAVPPCATKIAIFGEADKIAFKFGEGAKIKSAAALSLFNDESLGNARLCGDEIIVTSELIKKATVTDKSAPALVLEVELF